MKWFPKILSGVARRPWLVAIGLMMILLAPASLRAQCPGCVTFNPGILWSNVSFGSLDEASGLAVSTRNPGVVWSHNDDGNDGRLFAFRTNGTGLARYEMNVSFGGTGDIEDMAVGPGPVAGVQYLYVGDIGGGDSVRNTVRIVRIPEPMVPPLTPSGPPVLDFTGVQVFTLRYPTFFFWDAEGMLVDPLTSDLYIFTKFNGVSYVYRANLNASPTNVVDMELVLTVPFHEVSGAAISHDGSQIALRNEFTAQIWLRCPGETISNALARAGQTIPVMSFAAEPNGEAIAFLPNNRGYLTTTDSPPGASNSEKEDSPPIHFFGATCAPTVITAQPQSTTNVVGANALFIAQATGENLQYQWRFNGGDLAGENTNLLWLTSLQTNQAGLYSLRVVGDGGAATSAAARLGVRVVKPGISLQPARLTYAPTGGTARLTAVATGSPPFHYNWTFGAKPLNQNTNVLTLLNVSNRSSGSYRVTVTNSAGKAISAFGALRVQIPPYIIIPPVSRTNKVNSLTTFRVGVRGTPPFRYQWYFNGNAISNAIRPTLTLTRLQATNSGLYSVRVTNYVGTNFSAPAQLTVP